MRESPSAPAASQARAISAMSVTFGVSFTMTGFLTAAFTARVTSAALAQLVPKPMPPPWTLGQLIFTSSQPTSGQLSNFAATSTYSSTEKPQTFAITGLRKTCRSRGSSSAITASTPGFWRPTEFKSPEGASAILGPGFPKRGARVVPLKEKVPRQFMS